RGMREAGPRLGMEMTNCASPPADGIQMMSREPSELRLCPRKGALAPRMNTSLDPSPEKEELAYWLATCVSRVGRPPDAGILQTCPPSVSLQETYAIQRPSGE